MITWTLEYARTLVGKEVGPFNDVIEKSDVKDLKSLLLFCDYYLASPFSNTHIENSKNAVVFEMYC